MRETCEQGYAEDPSSSTAESRHEPPVNTGGVIRVVERPVVVRVATADGQVLFLDRAGLGEAQGRPGTVRHGAASNVVGGERGGAENLLWYWFCSVVCQGSYLPVNRVDDFMLAFLPS